MTTERTPDAKHWRPKMPLDRTGELENPPRLEDIVNEFEQAKGDDALKDKPNPAIREDTNRDLVESAAPVFVERDKRHSLLAKAAYYISERRGFLPGAEVDDWLGAETEIDHAFTFAK